MTGMAEGAKFSNTTQGHQHPNTPRVFISAAPPTKDMKRGDIWINVNATVVVLEDHDSSGDSATE